jgi:hypothetical protein
MRFGAAHRFGGSGHGPLEGARPARAGIDGNPYLPAGMPHHCPDSTRAVPENPSLDLYHRSRKDGLGYIDRESPDAIDIVSSRNDVNGHDGGHVQQSTENN